MYIQTAELNSVEHARAVGNENFFNYMCIDMASFPVVNIASFTYRSDIIDF